MFVSFDSLELHKYHQLFKCIDSIKNTWWR